MSNIPKPWISPEVLKSRGDGGMNPLYGLRLIPRVPALDYDPSQPYWPEFCQIEERRGTKLVGMDDRNRIWASASEEKRIATFGLGGCTAAAIVAGMPDGFRYGYVQHYNPLNRSLGVKMLEKALKEANEALTIKGLIMVGAWPVEYGSGLEINPNVWKYAESLKDIILQHPSAIDNEIGIRGYSMGTEVEGGYAQGTLTVEFLRDGKTNIWAESELI